MHPLVELSSAVYPEQVRHPAARAALLTCTERLRAVLPPGCWPFPHQMIGIAYAHLAQDRCLISDEQGLGKTPMGIGRIAVGRYERTVVITTASTLSTWEEELAKWLPRTARWVMSTEASTPPAPGWRGVVLTTWDLAKYRFVSVIPGLRPDLVICDEAHAIRNPETIRYEAATRILADVPRVLLLTGTPVVNRASEIWTLLHLLDPRAWPEETRDALDDVSRTELDGAAVSRVTQRLRQYMLRRLKQDVPTGIPDKSYCEIPVELAPDERVRYDAADKQFRRWLERHLRMRAEDAARELGRPVTAKDLHLIQRRVENAVKRDYLVKIGYLRRLVGIAKVPTGVRWALDHVRAGESCVIFLEHKEVREKLVDDLEARGVQPAVIDGGTSKAERQRIRSAFQSGKIRVLVASQAAREGVTLTAARYLLQLERWWNPAGESQAADRIHRITQTRKVTISRAVVRDTIDDRLDEINREKAEIVRRVVGG